MKNLDKQAAFLSASIDTNIPEIDLHECSSVSDGLEMLEQGLYAFSKDGDRYCRVIHGIGSGVLASSVQDELKNHPLVADFKVDDHGGSCTVLL